MTSNTNADSTSAPETGSSGAWGKATFANVSDVSIACC